MLKEIKKLDDEKSFEEASARLASYALTFDEFQRCLKHTCWNNELEPLYVDKLFCIATGGTSKNDIVPLKKYFQLIAWMGDPKLSERQAIPIRVVITCYEKISIYAKESFYFLTDKELNKFTNSCAQDKTILRLNIGCTPLTPSGSPKPENFYRNLILTYYNTNTKIWAHKILFTFDHWSKLLHGTKEWMPEFDVRGVPYVNGLPQSPLEKNLLQLLRDINSELTIEAHREALMRHSAPEPADAASPAAAPTSAGPGPGKACC